MAQPSNGVMCPYCGDPAMLKDSSVVYYKSYGLIWDCRKCDAYVGVHKGSKTHEPLGRLANKELRGWKIKAHAAFDSIWRTGKLTRSDAYATLARRLGIPARQAHIGMFDVEQCKRVVLAFPPDGQ